MDNIKSFNVSFEKVKIDVSQHIAHLVDVKIASAILLGYMRKGHRYLDLSRPLDHEDHQWWEIGEYRQRKMGPADKAE